MGQGYSTRLTGAAATAARARQQRHQANRLRTQAPAGNTSISDGRELIVKDTDGNRVVGLGHDSLGNRGMSCTSPAGIDMFAFLINPISGNPEIGMVDSTGFLVAASDHNGDGTGMLWPYMPITMAGMTISQWPFNTTGTFTTVSQGGGWKMSQQILVMCQTICDGGATAGQARLLVNGHQVGSTAAVTTGIATAIFQGFVTADAPTDSEFIEVQTRVTTGSGNCRAQPYVASWVEAAF